MFGWLINKLAGFKACKHEPSGGILSFDCYNSPVEGKILMTLQKCKHCNREYWLKDIAGHPIPEGCGEVKAGIR